MSIVRVTSIFVVAITALCIAQRAHAADNPPPVPFTESYSSPLGEEAGLTDYLRAMRGPDPPKIGLVLSGGGARGLAQIGVLDVLERNHIPLHFIVGTSIGALVGGLYAAGYTPHELDSIARSTDWDELLVVGDERYRRELFYDQKLEHDRSILTLQLKDFSPVVPDAISLGQRFTMFVNRLVWGAPFHPYDSFDDMRIPFRCVATDIASGKRVVFDRGNLADVLRASATAPLRFTPINKDSMVLVDGGLLSNIPTDVAKEAGCDIIIVVNTTSPLHDGNELVQPWDVADQVITVMMRKQYASALQDAGIVITPNIGSHEASDFTSIDMLIANGDLAASQQLPALLAVIADKRGSAHMALAPELHFHSEEFSAKDIPYLGQAAGHALSMPTLFDSLAASGRYSRLSMNVRPDGAGVAEVTAVTNPIIQQVTILPAGHPTAFDSMAHVLQGAAYGAGSVLPVLETMLRWYRSAGLAYGNITRTHFDKTTGMFTINVADGPIRSIVVAGNVITDNDVITRELPLTVGSPFLSAKGERTLRNLNTTNIFRQATLEVVPHMTDVDVKIHVTEQNSQVLRISGRLDNERNTQLGAEIAEDNLFGEGLHLGALVFGGLRNENVELTFSSHRILTTYLSYNATVYRHRRDVNVFNDSQLSLSSVAFNNFGGYSQAQTGLRFSVGENVPGLGLVGITARYENQQQQRTSGLGPEGNATVFTLKGNLVLDTQNDFPFPTSGTVLNLSYESALRLFGANKAFSKFFVTYDDYFTISKRHTIHPQFSFGFTDETTPLAEQFRIGGQYMFYGLREDQYVGNQILTGGLEYRYRLPVRLFFDTYLTARYDIGTVWPRVEDVQFGDLRHGAGMGIGFETPIGPADFAMGKSFTLANPIGGKSFAVFGPWVFYFSVGSRL